MIQNGEPGRCGSDQLKPHTALTVCHPAADPVGIGTAIGHHGEVLQGAIEGPDRRLQRCLVTLPCPLAQSKAHFYPQAGAELTVHPAWKVKSLQAARLVAAAAGRPGVGGCLTVDTPVPARWGFGSSTSDVIAAVRAVAAALNYAVSPDDVARLAVEAETASDSTMFGHRAVLFAQREGAVLEDLGGRLPRALVVGFNTDRSGYGVDTLNLPPARYSWQEIELFRPMLGLLRRAVREGDPVLLGRVTTASARVSQRHLPKPHFDEFERLVERAGALGLQVSHSGSLVGLLFDPSTPALAERVGEARCFIDGLGFGPTWEFTT